MYYIFQNPRRVMAVLGDPQKIDSYIATHTHQIEGLILATGIAAIIWVITAGKRGRSASQSETDLATIPKIRPYSSHEITQAFLSSIPTVTGALNLEVATSEQVETFDRTDEVSILWGFLDLGVNTASIQVPVTYRYHIRLSEPWKLELEGNILRVVAPEIRASQPPAFHSDQMLSRSVRGWFRRAPDELLQRLHQEITPIISRYAEDPRRIDLIRETCRQTTTEFVRKCLVAGPAAIGPVQQIQVRFAGETRTDHSQLPRLQYPPPIP